MKTRIYIESEIKNISGRFQRAAWREYSVMRIYDNAGQARKFHNLRNCNYYYFNYDENGEEVITRRYDNYNSAAVNAYGRRY